MIVWVPAETGAENELHAFRLGEVPVQLSELSTLCGMRSNMHVVKSLIIPIGTRCEICEHRTSAKRDAS